MLLLAAFKTKLFCTITNEQLKKLEKDLWDAANSLRAYGGIKAADYAVPVLGLQTSARFKTSPTLNCNVFLSETSEEIIKDGVIF